MADMWFLASKGKGYGPFSTPQLQQMVEAGVIDPDDLVWRDGDSESAPVSTVGKEPPLPVAASRPSPPPLPVSSTPAPSRRSSRLGWWLSLSAVLLAMLGGGGWFAYQRGWLPLTGSVEQAKTLVADDSLANTSPDKEDGEEPSISPAPKDVDESEITAVDPIEPNSPATEVPIKNPTQHIDVSLPATASSLNFDDDRALFASKRLVLVNGINGTAALFENKSSIQVPCSLPEGSAPRTLSAWIKSTGPSDARNSHAIAYGSNTSGRKSCGVYHANGKWGIYGWGNQHATEAVVDSEWHHHCLTFDGTTISYWYDGRSVARIAHSLNTTDGPLTLGSDITGSTYFSFKGLIDDVAVYDVALGSAKSVRRSRRPSGQEASATLASSGTALLAEPQVP